jgi:hypothetical protein
MLLFIYIEERSISCKSLPSTPSSIEQKKSAAGKISYQKLVLEMSKKMLDKKRAHRSSFVRWQTASNYDSSRIVSEKEVEQQTKRETGVVYIDIRGIPGAELTNYLATFSGVD